MKVTDVRVRRLMNEGKMKAILSVTINEAFVIHDVKVVEGQSGLFVAMPSRKMADGTFRDVAHPISQEARAIIQNDVMSVYYRALEEAEAGEEAEEAAVFADEEWMI